MSTGRALNPLAEAYLARLKDSIERASAMGRMSSWLQKNTSLGGVAFSFKDHEFQEEIVDDRHPSMVVKKPSQVGLSELMARMMLGFLAMVRDSVCLYTAPSGPDAQTFIKSRVDPVIRGSRYLRSILVTGSD